MTNEHLLDWLDDIETLIGNKPVAIAWLGEEGPKKTTEALTALRSMLTAPPEPKWEGDPIDDLVHSTPGPITAPPDEERKEMALAIGSVIGMAEASRSAEMREDVLKYYDSRIRLWQRIRALILSPRPVVTADAIRYAVAEIMAPITGFTLHVSDIKDIIEKITKSVSERLRAHGVEVVEKEDK